MKLGNKLAVFLGISGLSLIGYSSAACSGLVSLAALNKANTDAASASYCTSFEQSSGIKGECVLNTDAVVSINKAIRKYGVTARGEIVATIAWMLYESGNWKYNINHFPGTIGQGTRTMMSWSYVSKYAQQVHADAYNMAVGLATADVSTADNQTKTAVIDLVLNNDDSFAAGFWYLTTQAPTYHNSASNLRDGNMGDFQAYVEQGIQTTWNADRQAIWEQVNAAIVF